VASTIFCSVLSEAWQCIKIINNFRSRTIKRKWSEELSWS
jgi:hypothetical protein